MGEGAFLHLIEKIIAKHKKNLRKKIWRQSGARDSQRLKIREWKIGLTRVAHWSALRVGSREPDF